MLASDGSVIAELYTKLALIYLVNQELQMDG